jgi:cytochrome b561
MNEKYSVSIRFIHWLMFILFAIIFVLGVVMVEFKETEPWAMYHFHKSTGVLVFLLVLLRLVFRVTSKAPSAPAEISPGNYRLSQGVVFLLYLLMILVPLSGYALSNMHGFAVDLYGLPLPNIFPESPDWEDYSSLAHEYLAYTFLGIFLLHLAGVIKHHVQGVEILRRIT